MHQLPVVDKGYSGDGLRNCVISSTLLREKLKSCIELENFDFLKETWLQTTEILKIPVYQSQIWFWTIVQLHQQEWRKLHTLSRVHRIIREIEILKRVSFEEKIALIIGVFFRHAYFHPRSDLNSLVGIYKILRKVRNFLQSF